VKNTLAKKLKQVPGEYLVLGIDPHKKKHAAVAITQDFSTLAKFKFDNTRAGFESMLERAKEVMVKSNCRGIMFAIDYQQYSVISPSDFLLNGAGSYKCQECVCSQQRWDT